MSEIIQTELFQLRLITEKEKLEIIKKYFTRYIDGYQFMPAFRSGMWSGKICMIRESGTFPYGLLIDVIRAWKLEFPRDSLKIDPIVKEFFNAPTLEPTYNLKHKPYSFQQDCVEAALYNSKGIIRSATASGKSLVIAYIIKTLLENVDKTNVKKNLIVVPNQSLVEQFYDDLIDYGFSSRDLGRVYYKYKGWNRKVVVATWQTLSKHHKRLNSYDSIIIDEAHHSKAFEIRKILSKAKNPRYRLGFTGTLHISDLDNWNIKAYLGPIIREYPSGLLAEQNYISKCTVLMISVDYHHSFSGSYVDIKDKVFINPFRMHLIEHLIKDLDHNVLILVSRIDKEGEALEKVLKQKIKDREIVFLSGRDNVNERKRWINLCKRRNNIILIATYQIFQQGINIPSLKYVFFGSPTKSRVRVLQSIGRSLRKHGTKEREGAKIFDIIDNVKYLSKYGKIRKDYYIKEGFEVETREMREGEELKN